MKQPPKRKPTKLWLYLARRDSQGIRILTVFAGQQQPPTRLANLKTLQIPSEYQAELERTIRDDRMMWEPWIESADSYELLRAKLKKRGYANTPSNGQPEIMYKDTTHTASTSALPKARTMLRRKP